MLRDLETILTDINPTNVLAPHPADLNVDHRALALFLQVALLDLKSSAPVYSYLVHAPARLAVAAKDPEWVRISLSDGQMKTKLAALEKHRTQWTYSARFLKSFVRDHETFDPRAFEKPNTDGNLKTWDVFIDGKNLIVTGSLIKSHRGVSTEYTVAVFGISPRHAF